MAIPAAVDNLLREHNIQYNVEALPPHTLLPADAATNPIPWVSVRFTLTGRGAASPVNCRVQPDLP